MKNIHNYQNHLILKLVILLSTVTLIKGQSNLLLHAHPCTDNRNIIINYETGRPPGEQNQYGIYLQGSLAQNSVIKIKFNSDVLLNLNDGTNARVTKKGDVYQINMFNSAPGISMKVLGQVANTVPYIQSFVINDEEKWNFRFIYSRRPIKDQVGLAVSTIPEGSCGKRKISHTGLIIHGLSTKPGDWPWHAAISVFDGYSVNYVCGGTLISKTVVLTAAHCVTIEGATRITNSVGVVLGRHKLFRYDIYSQDREVQNLVIHADYNHHQYNNDIALIKLKTEVIFNDYVQPACLWEASAETKLPAGEIYGMVVGWGINENNTLSQEIRKTKLPIKSELDCIKSKPAFFATLLTDHKFCAGYRNGTSPCNGDSGGGFMIFVPDVAGDASPQALGSWYVRGIVSSSPAKTNENVCDPYHYALFTDVAKFGDWILKNMN